jgi:nitric oxide reductase NorD protein
MSPLSRAQLQLIETPPDRAVTRLHQLVRQREILRASFRDTWERVAADAAEAELEAWAAGALELALVNAGPGCLIAFWRVSLELRPPLGLDALAALARACADVCRHAGAAATLACLETTNHALRCLGTRSELALWSRGLVRLARDAPESVVAVASRTETILQSCDGAAFESFVAAGLRAGGQDRARRRAFFTLEDPLARQVLERAAGALSFSDVERTLKAFATALWGRPPILRGAGPADGRPTPRRASFAGGIVRVPQVFRGVPASAAPQLFRACVAHASAHLALSPERFAVASLKPLQIALIGLIEDARIETLAMRRFPGLRRLWAPFHVAAPAGVSTAPSLLARLARALFDPAYLEDDGFVAKGRALFGAEAERLDDPSLSRRIGGLLGNDLGQMRVQFNTRTYVVEPVYRDDGHGLWDVDDPSQISTDAIDLVVEAARITQRDDPDEADRRHDEAGRAPPATGRAREAPPDDRGIVIATYPEWDRAAGVERPDWTTVRDVTPVLGDDRRIDAALDRVQAVRARIHRLVRGARIGRHERQKRRPDGPELDLDAALDAAIAIRTGEIPDGRIYRTTVRRRRDLAVMILIDVSESTRDHAGAVGGTVLDVERLAVAVLGEALSARGDPFALRAFASAGREAVRVTRIKDFGESYDAMAKARLAGLAPGLSTRIGAALRHAGAEIASVRSHRKLILVLTDGEPSDIDVTDPRDLVDDARRATLALKARGIDVVGVTLDPSGAGSGATVFGRGHHMPVRRLEELPSRLAALYFRLARR